MTRQLVVLGVAAALGACATVSPPTVPANLQTSGQLAGMVAAKGVQIYQCDEGQWRFRGVEATLMEGSKEVGSIQPGPTFAFADGGKVGVKAKAESPAPGYAVPWRLYDATASGGGKYGNVKSAQMVNTQGGRAPEGACSKNQDKINIRVNYTADYYLYN
jgi:hypothetical protein